MRIDFSFFQGASFVELDVQLTKDLVPIVFHDDFAAIIEEKVYKKLEIWNISLNKYRHNI